MCPRKSKPLSSEIQIIRVRKYLRNRIMYNPKQEIRNLDEQYSHIFELLKRTIEMGEGNSAILIGPRGSGKTQLVNKVLNDLATEENVKNNVVLVKLHGLIHINDRLALIDITRQMQLENTVGDKVFGSFSENLNFLLDCLNSGNKKTSKPIIFILDEIDLFCAHLNQTLLYNLFDISQAAKVPICVLGITCRLDVTELFEKRVKSRFSHRQIFMYSNTNKNIESDFNDHLILCQRLLQLTVEDEKEYLEHCTTNKQFRLTWNKDIEELIENNTVINILKTMFYNNSCEKNLRKYLYIVISSLSEKNQKLELKNFVEASKSFLEDDKITILMGLSVLEMCLIVAILHETKIHDDEPFNFKMILSRCLQFMQNSSELKTVKTSIILKAFEHLKNLELLIPVRGAITKVDKEYLMYNFALTQGQVMTAIKKYKDLPTEIMYWASHNTQL